jgi:catechol 2,3-dioxygenase-like lactoylglutathione lyase family enzyme
MADILRRTTIIVRDAEVSARFHEQVFGMTRWMDTPFTLSGRQLAAGKAGDASSGCWGCCNGSIRRSTHRRRPTGSLSARRSSS